MACLLGNLTPNVPIPVRVCDVCGSLLSVFDSDKRLADHFLGKQHLGYQRMREMMVAIKERGGAARSGGREDREGGREDKYRPRDERREGREGKDREGREGREDREGREGRDRDRDRPREREEEDRRRARRSRSRSRDRRDRERGRRCTFPSSAFPSRPHRYVCYVCRSR